MPALTGDKPIMASGTVTLTMIVNLKRFVAREAAANGAGIDLFERIRGTMAFAHYLDDLPACIRLPFVRDTAEDDLLVSAHDMRIFRGYVHAHYFFPTYRLDEEAFLVSAERLVDDEVLVETFPLWDYRVTLTRNGFVVVRMIRHFEDVPLSAIAAEVQQVERARGGDLTYHESRSSWRIAMDVTAALVRAMGRCLAFTDDYGQPVHITFDPEMRRGRLPLHDRYTTVHLAHVYRDGQTVTPDQLTGEYASFALGLMRLATVLRGGAARDMRRRRPIRQSDLYNLAPWVTDLCLVTNDAMIVYTTPAEDLDQLEDLSGYTRAQFWQGVARGVERLVNLKIAWQLVERQSTELLTTVSNLTARVNDGLLDDDDKERLNALAQGVSLAFNILPDLRYALVPSTLTHATDVVTIYDHLLDQLGVLRIADHVNANMQELNAFLSYYSSTQLQYEGRAQEESENRTGLTISIMLILLSLVSVPSLIKDASEIDWATFLQEPPLQLAAVVGLSLLPLVLLLITSWLALRNLRRR